MQTRRLATSFKTYWVCRAYQTGEIPVQSHVRLGVFFFENPWKQPDAKKLIAIICKRKLVLCVTNLQSRARQ